MRRVFTAQSIPQAHLVRSSLEASGIRAIVQNEHIFDIRGEVPMAPDTMPEVWILDESQSAEAESIVDAFLFRRGASTSEEAGEQDEQDEHDDDYVEDFEEAWQAGRPSSLWKFVKFLFVLGLGFVVGVAVHDKILEARSEWYYNQDGKPDAFWKFSVAGGTSTFEEDANFDGNIDGKTVYDFLGIRTKSSRDTDFDGEFDEFFEYEKGSAKVSRASRSGKPPLVEKRYRHGILHTTLIDIDGDDKFDVKYEFDSLGILVTEEQEQPNGQ